MNAHAVALFKRGVGTAGVLAALVLGLTIFMAVSGDDVADDFDELGAEIESL